MEVPLNLIYTAQKFKSFSKISLNNDLIILILDTTVILTLSNPTLKYWLLLRLINTMSLC